MNSVSAYNFGLVAVLYKLNQRVKTHYTLRVNTIIKARTHTSTMTSVQPVRVATSHVKSTIQPFMVIPNIH